jgi:hypothetical protein
MIKKNLNVIIKKKDKMFARKSALSGHMYNVCDKTFALCFKPKSKNLIKFTFKYKFGKKT